MKRFRVGVSACLIVIASSTVLFQATELASDEMVTQAPAARIRVDDAPATTDVVLRGPSAKTYTVSEITYRVDMQPCSCVDKFPSRPKKSHK
jgi:hypothetical protein